MRGKAQLNGRPVVEFIDDDDSRQTVNFSKRITERGSDWANYERLLTMKKYTNWTFTSPLLDDYRRWHCVLSIQTRNVMLVDTVRTDGHDCRYSTTQCSQWRRQPWEFTRSRQGPENVCQVL